MSSQCSERWGDCQPGVCTGPAVATLGWGAVTLQWGRLGGGGPRGQRGDSPGAAGGVRAWAGGV